MTLIKTSAKSLGAFLVMSFVTCGQAYAEEDEKHYQAIELNNQGVMALDGKNYDKAISLLRQAVNTDPTYLNARKNLGVALSNKAIDLDKKGKKTESLRYMEASAACDPESKTTKGNLDEMIKDLNMNPASPIDRTKLGAKALLNGDVKNAAVEFKAALQNSGISIPNNLKDLFPIEKLQYTAPRDAFYKHYMQAMNGKIKSHWSPPADFSSHSIVIDFAIKHDGKAIIETPDNSSKEYKLAKEAILKAAPFSILYKNEPQIRVQYSFDYKIVNEKTK